MEVSERILREFSRIAVVGLSRDPSKAAHAIPLALQRAGFDIVPINPHSDALLGRTAFATLAAVPAPIEVVLVFRPSEEAQGIAEQAVQVGAKALWLQQGLRSAPAQKTARAAGLLYVEDRCIGVERALYGITKPRESKP